MLARSRDAVANDPIVAFQEEDFAFDRYRIRQTGKADVLGGDEVEAVVAGPLLERAQRDRLPGNGSVWRRGRFAIDGDGVVRRGAAKPVTPLFRPGVGVRAGIDEHGATVCGDVDRQSIGMSMTAGERAVRATIEKQVVSV